MSLRRSHSFMFCFAAIGISVLCASRVAHADDAAHASDAALAETLFQQAKILVAKGEYAEACPKLAESQRLDPGDGTLLALAVCHEAQGKLALAWSELTTLASKTDVRSDRAKRARDRLAAIEPKLGHITVVVPEATRRSAGGAKLEVLRDGVVLSEGAWGVAIPTDPGLHVIEARAAGKQPIRIELEARAGAKLEAVVPVLVALDAKVGELASGQEPVQPALSASPSPSPSAERAAPSSNSALRVTGIAVGAVGVAAIGVGAYFGARAFTLSDRAKGGCDNASMTNCSDEALATNADAKTAARIANFTLAGGAIAAASGVVMYLIAGRTAVVPYGDPRGSAGVLVRTSF